MHTFSIHFVSFTSLFIKSNNNSCNFPLNIFFSIHNNLSQPLPILTSELRTYFPHKKENSMPREKSLMIIHHEDAGIELNVWLAWLTSSDQAEPSRRKNDGHRYYYYYYYYMRCAKSLTKYKIHS